MEQTPVISTPHESISTKQVTFWQTVIATIISMMVSVVFVGMYAGGAMARLAEVEKKQAEQKEELKIQNDKIQRQLESLNDKVVNKEDFKELRKDFQDYVRKR